MEPDRTEIYIARNRDKLVLSTAVLMRLSNADDAPWRYVQTLSETDQGIKVRFLDEESVAPTPLRRTGRSRPLGRRGGPLVDVPTLAVDADRPFRLTPALTGPCPGALFTAPTDHRAEVEINKTIRVTHASAA